MGSEARPDSRSAREAISLKAAQWVVRVSSGDCFPEDLATLEAWLSESPAHQVAYERESWAWERTDQLQGLLRAGETDLGRKPPEETRRQRLAPSRRNSGRVWRAAAAVLVFASVCGAGFLWMGEDSKAYATAVGERRVVVLDDGSRLELNTDTRVQVRISRGHRRVTLLKGEALVDVRAGDRRPFTLAAADDEVRATGSVNVRLAPSSVQVLVVRGQADVSGRAGPDQSRFEARLPAGAVGAYGPEGAVSRTALPGEADRSLSWRYGAIVLTDQTLRQAAAEFNRYNTKQLVVADAAVADLRLGGYFQENDVQGFAEALQTTFGLRVRDAGGVVYITGPDGRGDTLREGAPGGPRRSS